MSQKMRYMLILLLAIYVWLKCNENSNLECIQTVPHTNWLYNFKHDQFKYLDIYKIDLKRIFFFISKRYVIVTLKAELVEWIERRAVMLKYNLNSKVVSWLQHKKKLFQ